MVAGRIRAGDGTIEYRPSGGRRRRVLDPANIPPMNILVTGASGFVGRGLVDRLAARGHAGLATGREPPAGMPAGWRAARRADVLAGAAFPAPFDRPDVIVHLEVKQHVFRPTPADIEAFRRTNVVGTREWLDWAARVGVGRFVLVSSIKAAVPAGAAEPDTPYGRSKADAEAAVREWVAAAPGRSAVVLRPAPVYGPGNQANLAAFARQILAGWPALVGAGEARKSIVSRENLAAAIEFAAARLVAGGFPGACETFDVSDPETLSVGQLATLIAELGHAVPPRRIPARLADMVAPLGDRISRLVGREFPLTRSRLRALREESDFPCDRLVAAGFEHPQSTREGIREMLDWMRRRG